jgi:hypothetical protein
MTRDPTGREKKEAAAKGLRDGSRARMGDYLSADSWRPVT